MRTLMSALAALTLTGLGCKEAVDTTDRPVAGKQVEEAQEQSAQAYDRAKEAQENAADEAREAARAQEDLEEKHQALTEAERKAAASQQEAQAAQQAARAEGEAAHREATEAQQRAETAQQSATQDLEARRGPATTRTLAPDRTPMASDDLERMRQQLDRAVETIKDTGGDRYETDDRIRRSDDVDTDEVTRPINPLVK